MKVTLPPYWGATWAAMSSTGPHTRDLQSAGVANSRTTGLRPSTSAKSVWESDLAGGTRVSTLEASPPTEASVGVCTRIALSPTRGGPLVSAPTSPESWPADCSLPPTRAMPRIVAGPSLANGTSATYTPLAASGSDAVVLLWNWGLPASD